MTEPTTTTPEALALATAARLAHALDPDGWARCRKSEFNEDNVLLQCNAHRGHVASDTVEFPWGDNGDPLPPTLAAAQAEWADAGGDPERGPALSGRSEDGRTTWEVDHCGRVQIVVGADRGDRFPMSNGALRWLFQGVSLADMRECVRLAEAADRGAR